MRGRRLDLARLMSRLYAEDPAQPDAVSLMTIHGAKGLEFDHVFVVGVGLRGRGDDRGCSTGSSCRASRAAIIW